MHLTDQHVHGVFAKNRFDKVLSLALAQKPDVIAITGDLMDRPGLPSKKAFDRLNEVKVPVLFVMGNHEFYVGDKIAELLLSHTPAKILRTAHADINGVRFLGVDDPTGGKKLIPELERLHYDPSKYQVLLYHQPLAELKAAKQKHVNLVLAGHTHAGQIFPFNLLIRLHFPFIEGMHHLGSMKVYVSPGAGTWGPAMRLGSQNTIAVINLLPSHKE